MIPSIMIYHQPIYFIIQRAVKSIVFYVILFQPFLSFCQTEPLNKWTYLGYGEFYYSHNFSARRNKEKPDFVYNHKKNNALNVNLAFFKAKYSNGKLRTNLGLMAGNYVTYNLASEPLWARHINEANIGFKLSNKHNIWLDAGVMPSHIGFESAVSADCWTLTRSILAENSPYFETGLKLGYANKRENLTLALLVLNGWQRIKKPSHVQYPSLGLQINYKINDDLLINYSNFIGSDNANYSKGIRTFHNFYLQHESKRKIGVILGFDIGTDQYSFFNYGAWFSPVLMLRYSLSEKIKIALRSEYYRDRHQIIVKSNSLNGFQVSGISTNFDWKINRRFGLRTECKILNSTNNIFQFKTNNDFSWTSNFTVQL